MTGAEFLAVAAVVLVAAVLVEAIVAIFVFLVIGKKKVEGADPSPVIIPWRDGPPNIPYWSSPPESDEQVTTQAPVPTNEPEPLPGVDPDNPPTWKTYQPSPTSRTARLCHCHGRAIEPGSRILWWPVLDGGGAVVLFCEPYVREAGYQG